MKKLLSLLLALVLVFSIVGCTKGGTTDPTPTPSADVTTPTDPTPDEPTPTASPDPVEIIVFAATSMTATLEEIKTLYAEIAPWVTITYTFGSSGTLRDQIKSGAEADVFISAGQAQMNDLGDLVNADTRYNLVENRLVLVVANGNPGNIHTFEDAADAESIAIGAVSVPAGDYAREVFTYLGVLDKVEAKATLGEDVGAVATLVSTGEVDCGVVYVTDANSKGLEIVQVAPAEALTSKVLYPAAVLADSAVTDDAQAFLDFLKTPAASAVFETAGFGIVG
ncbi:MAG: molybdate ABC transporter substrate-binding protein [Oscillospiraceae bacterium]|jgi:molybdate transport system substrate-binding protein|nr:molybdate ABC transporter substrate-binding protein [Oscillospiraceae bacterium]